MRLFRLWLGSSGLFSGFKRASGFQGSKNLLKTYILILLIVQPKPRTPCPTAFKNPYRNQEGLQSKTLNPEPLPVRLVEFLVAAARSLPLPTVLLWVLGGRGGG